MEPLTEHRQSEIALALYRQKAGTMVEKDDSGAIRKKPELERIALASDLPYDSIVSFLESLANHETRREPEKDLEVALTLMRAQLLMLLGNGFEEFGGVIAASEIGQEIGVSTDEMRKFFKDILAQLLERFIAPDPDNNASDEE